ncbi:MAG: hypothetical protein E7472_03235 [Ruminococcaceae bacterium]|nr:hypothetical protein [Oscillospiraceae bacterium]
MSDFEDKLNSILSDPEELEKITRMAAQLMGGAERESGGAPPEDAGLPGFDPEMIGRIGRLLGGAERKNDRAGLVGAILPYLRPERQTKLQKAMRMAKMARLAGQAMKEYGGEGGL